MKEEKGLQIVLAARPQGAVRLNDFQAKEFPVPAISAGELLLKVNYLSLDPYMRGRMDDRKSYAQPAKIGDVMPGETISTVIASEHPRFATGDLVLAHTGSREAPTQHIFGERELDTPGVFFDLHHKRL